MKTKIAQFVPTFLVLFGVGFSYFSLWCTGSANFCHGGWVDSIFLEVINPLYFFSLYSLPLAIILIFVSRPVFKTWLKLAAWMLPVICIVIATQPVSWTGISINPFFISRDGIAFFSAVTFSVFSLVAIIFASYRQFLGGRGVPQEATERRVRASRALTMSALSLATFPVALVMLMQNAGTLNLVLSILFFAVIFTVLSFGYLIQIVIDAARTHRSLDRKETVALLLILTSVVLYVGGYSIARLLY